MGEQSAARQWSTALGIAWLFSVCLSPDASSSDLTPDLDGVDFLYIESNTGGSSGGHVALHINHDVFHFQHESGFNHLTRNSWTEFVRTYSEIENRDIHAAPLNLSTSDAERVADRLNLARLTQEAHLEHLRALEAEAQFLGLAIEDQRDALEKALLFAPDASPDADMRELAFRLKKDHISTIQVAANQQGSQHPELQLGPSLPVKLSSPLDTEHYPVYSPTWLQSARSNYLWEHLKTAIERGWSIRLNAVINVAQVTSHSTARLNAEQMQWMRAWREELYQFITKGLQRPKLFPSQAIEMAIGRYLLAGKSLRNGSLAVLDLSALDSNENLKGGIATPANNIPLNLQLKESTLRRIKIGMLDSESKELAFRQLEEKVAEIVQLQRLSGISPSHPEATPRQLLPLSSEGTETLTHESLQQAKERHEAFHEAFMNTYRYHLLTRNCATELMRELEAIKPIRQQDAASSHPDSFVPFRLYEYVQAKQPSTERAVIPSLHHRLTAALETRDPLKGLSELSTLTSTSYTPRSEDGAFLLFTDQSPFFLRPVLGAGNLTYSLLAGAIGVLKLPVDHGDELLEGLYGALFSLPELAGWNIRKGSYSGDDPRISLPYP